MTTATAAGEALTPADEGCLTGMGLALGSGEAWGLGDFSVTPSCSPSTLGT
eukprot:CAMPEP_0174375130 /NCGR_PEP_ID=MMETSP0811_2-20130205/113435_1 /TAXON_ID=73025 ORGANISM="Eutreptiella gymnastica-like, Strain CCMP1594" /NCGR_SAMPLE_ID=MMETSP0811_2 /ASSEMBLY_ACC=CAM_ASM_000667 /LENGTH=50 /DNA_ID=CAMNT_0015525061 /DNA_START=844 /DNA_END=996 /DNA_ORIENTATION=-